MDNVFQLHVFPALPLVTPPQLNDVVSRGQVAIAELDLSYNLVGDRSLKALVQLIYARSEYIGDGIRKREREGPE